MTTFKSPARIKYTSDLKFFTTIKDTFGCFNGL